jgi:hypothetical protein
VSKPEEIEDADFRVAIEEADRLLNEGDYTSVARRCAETYVRLLLKRPDLLPDISTPGGLPGRSRAMWPRTGGISLTVDGQRKPALTFQKERFSFSEAATYFEFLRAELHHAEQHPPGA